MEKQKVYASNEDELKEKVKSELGEDKEFNILEIGEEKGIFKKRKYYIIEVKEKEKEEEKKEILVPNPYIEFEIDESDGIGYIKIKETDLFPSYEEIIKTIEYYKNPYKIDEEKIRRVIEIKKFNEKFPISFRKDASVKIFIEKNELECYILVEQPYGGKEIEKEDILKALKEKNITYGILNDIIEEIVSKKKYNEKILVAKGEEPINGEDGKIIYNFDIEKKYELKEEAFRRVDYKEIGIIQTVKKGTILAEKIPPTEGKPGMSVTGKVLKQKSGKDVKLNATKGASLTEDGLRVIAEIDGSPFLRGSSIGVEPLLIIEKVDFKTGNIKFDGSVKIIGDVLPGFKIFAKGNIEIGGVVDECEIECDGNLFIGVGINNKNKYKVRCKGNFKTRYIESTEVDCEGDIETEMIINSNIYCQGKIVAVNGKGVISGGEVSASNGIIVKTLGSPFGSYTIVNVGFTELVSSEIRYFMEIFEESSKILEETLKDIEYLKSKGEKEDFIEKLNFKALHMKLRAESFKNKIEKKKELTQKIQHASVVVEFKTFPNVNIVINGIKFKVEEELGPCRFYEKDGKIELGAI